MIAIQVLLAGALVILPAPFQGWGKYTNEDRNGKSTESRTCCDDNSNPLPWDGYNKGVEWTQSNDKAFARAKKEKRPLLFFHLVGDMDKGGC
jgi:hypothetical protein